MLSLTLTGSFWSTWWDAKVMHEMGTHLFARLDRGLNVPIGRQGGRVFRRVAGRDAVQQAVIEDAELAKAADVVALDARFG